MLRGISWEQLHDQIGELLPVLDPSAAGVARQALQLGQEARARARVTDHDLDAVLDQVTEVLARPTLTKPEQDLLLAVQDLLLGLSSSAVLSSHLVAAWPKVQAARRALAARATPPPTDLPWVPGDDRRVGDRPWLPGSRHEAVAVAAAPARPL